MTLYHFCPAHMLEGIKKHGLILGKFPLLGSERISFITECQWLTADPNPFHQSWATRQLIPYSRTAYRLTIDIPMSRLRKLHRATTFVKDMPQKDQEIVTRWAGSEHWYIYKGKIPATWIKDVVKTGAVS